MVQTRFTRSADRRQAIPTDRDLAASVRRRSADVESARSIPLCSPVPGPEPMVAALRVPAGSEAVTISGIFEEVGPAWVLLLVVLFVGVVYWAFRLRRPRPGDDDPVK